MSAATVTPFRPAPPRARRPVVSSAVLATVLFVMSEVMYFLALMSSFNVIRSKVFGTWAPPGDVKLPVLATALNTVVLLVSGILLILAARAYAKPETKARAQSLFLQSIVLGACFVAFQGYEWIKLIQYGMTMTSGIFGATFFLLIGSHGLHALAAVIAMAVLYRKMTQGKLKPDAMAAMAVFWLFVVGVWPVLYGLVYFS